MASRLNIVSRKIFFSDKSVFRRYYDARQELRRNYSSSSETAVADVPKKEKISKAMKAYLERSKAHGEFLKQEQHLFDVGKRHLANMMGADAEHFTQDDIDKSIRYLFPSALYEPKARPLMKPPSEVFPKTKEAEFDETGRPFHPFFYTARPYLAQLLHDAAKKISQLNEYEDKVVRKQVKPDRSQSLDLLGSDWLSREALEGVVLEKVVEIEYKKFLAVMERLAQHPYSYLEADFLHKYRYRLTVRTSDTTDVVPQETVDGRRSVTISDCARKSVRGSVTVTYPGTGKFSLNGQGLEQFTVDQSRKQVCLVDRASVSERVSTFPDDTPIGHDVEYLCTYKG